MKRQEAVSSSRREGSLSIGCMSGVFQLLYKSSHRRRLLAFEKVTSNFPGKTKEKKRVSPLEKSVGNSVIIIKAENSKEGSKISTIKRFSCDVPRSPTMPSEIRRSNSINSPENLRDPPALVARLMGLEEGPVMTPESGGEKTRKLLRALDRCDEALKASNRIIEDVKIIVGAADGRGGDTGDEKIKRCSSRPVPVVVSHRRHVVLDELARCAFSGGGAKRHSNVMIQHQQRKMMEQPFQANIRSRDDYYYCDMWNHNVMIETVNELCRDTNWGEKLEVGKIGLALNDRIWRDLVDEILGDMKKCFLVEVHRCSLPLEACRKRLRF